MDQDNTQGLKELLLEGGGWKAMKEARTIHASGQVSEATYLDGLLSGLVRIKGRETRVSLRIHSATSMENHCSCYPARRDGLICGHAIALGLEVLKPSRANPPPTQGDTLAKQPEKKAAPERKISDDWPDVTESPDPESEAAELHLVLPGNFAKGWEKGQLLCGVECHTTRGPQLLAAVSASTRLFLDASDAQFFRALQSISPETVPGMLNLGRDDFLDLLSSLTGHSRITLAKKRPAVIDHRPMRPTLVRSAKIGRLRADIENNAGRLLVPSGEASEGTGTWLFTDEASFLPIAPGLPSRYRSLLGAGLTLDAETLRDRCFLDFLDRHFDAEGLEIQQGIPVPCAHLEGSLRGITVRLSFDYDETRFPAFDSEAGTAGEVSFEEDGKLVLRDTVSETEAIEVLRSHGFEGPAARGEFRLRDKDRVLAFLAHGYPSLPEGWKNECGERFTHASTLVEPIQPTLDFQSSGEDWFSVAVDYAPASGAGIPKEEIRGLLRSGQSIRKLSTGKIAVLDEDIQKEVEQILVDCNPRQENAGQYRMDLLHEDYLLATAQEHRLPTRGTLPRDERTRTSAEFDPLPAFLADILRPYQQTGVEWLQEAAQRKGGGILADDMGLGKTLQALSFLYIAGGQTLVVAPSSLVHNWVAEAEKFTPDLKVVALEGPKRHEVLTANEDAHIYVTSYALLRRDAELYHNWHFRTVFLDEAQHIKNPDSQIAKCAHQLQGTFKFAITGTPIENSVRDLWSILQFAVPGALGSRKDFQARYEKPLAKASPDPAIRNRLQRRLRSLMLRRLKTEVAPDLPEKITQVVPCILSAEQRTIYQQILRESREKIAGADGGQQHMVALTALLRLRQCCCDLRLLGLESKEGAHSPKAPAIEELLDNAIAGGHRILVFSQFVEMLQVLVPYLGERGIDFAYLDGKTKKRGEVVARFQDDPGIPVFLISLKAGGVGLNLTGADTVIHLDPWWNPAVEDQATDRAHRIGQTRVVTSYKLIAEDTVEEKILALQGRKRSLTDNLTQTEILDLLK